MLLELGQPFYGYANYGYWIDIGDPGKYLQLNHDLLLGSASSFCHPVVRQSFIHPTAQIKGAVLIGEGCDIGPDVLIQGPAVIGTGCRIRAGAVIEGSVLWSDIRVGRKATLRGCIIADNCFIADGRYIGNGSVLGDNTILS
jgi:NDP-sugar pyrophosphorylase family protein